ncbi:MAG: DUF5615 family PIN-like protein [Dermatophilaceae bacterium]
MFGSYGSSRASATTSFTHRRCQTATRTSDARIAEVADEEGRVVVTKDRDFRDAHLLSGSPRRLLVVATGNITNTALLALFNAEVGSGTQEAEQCGHHECAADMTHRLEHPGDDAASGSGVLATQMRVSAT